MPQGSSKKRESQYEHIKEGAEKRGTSEGAPARPRPHRLAPFLETPLAATLG